MASAGARAYNGDLGAEPPSVGSRGKASGQGFRGQSPPEAESILKCSLQATNFRRKIGRKSYDEYVPFLSRSTVFLQSPELLSCHSNLYTVLLTPLCVSKLLLRQKIKRLK